MRPWLRAALCVLSGGHYEVLRTDGGRLFLRCTACDTESPGVVPTHPRRHLRYVGPTTRAGRLRQLMNRYREEMKKAGAV